MSVSITNMALARFETAAALQHAATHFEVRSSRTDLHNMLVQILRAEAQEIIQLGLSELEKL